MHRKKIIKKCTTHRNGRRYEIIVSFSFLLCFSFESEDDRWSSLPRPKITTEPTPSTSIAANTKQNLLQLYAQPSTSRQFQSNASPFSSTCADATHRQTPKISKLDGDKFKNSPHSSSQESNNSHSDHSGGSGATLRLDGDDNDSIDYADA